MYEIKGWDFEAELKAFMEYGYVLATPRHFILASVEPTHWYIHICVGYGALNYFASTVPVLRPKIAFARGLRDKPIKFYNMERVLKLCALLKPTNELMPV